MGGGAVSFFGFCRARVHVPVPHGHTDMVTPWLGANRQLKISSFFSCCPLMSSSLENQVPEIKHSFLPPLGKHFRDLETGYRLIKKSFWFCPLDIPRLTWVSSRTPSSICPGTRLSGCPKASFPGLSPWNLSASSVTAWPPHESLGAKTNHVPLLCLLGTQTSNYQASSLGPHNNYTGLTHGRLLFMELTPAFSVDCCFGLNEK